jgi:WD40 repeat protein/mono/diheme cytochrome c family protein
MLNARPRPFLQLAVALSLSPALLLAAVDEGKPVSYYKQVRPIFQANCQGCHQPAKAKGGYIMTDFTKLLRGGESAEKGEVAIVAKEPDKSLLVNQITPASSGEQAEMPPKKAALVEKEIALIRRWISEGAADDTPANARQRIDAEHPPIYHRPPVITSIDLSPDGSMLAVAGFHEVLLWNADGSEMLARLIGLSERIQTVRFSPDGKRLAACGGRPAQMGEIQIWDVEKRTLTISIPFGFDTVYGVNWSPDGKLVSIGAPDNSLRAFDAANGQQVLQQSSHSDWVLDTVFNHKGDQLVSVGRDMSTKLTDVATQRFIDNISSITPGALRGGLHSVARHPERDEFLVGGSDGEPQAFRTVRKVQRRIGDNALCIRKWPAMEGRIYAVDYAPDGKSFTAGSSLDGKGAVHFYNYDFNTEMPADILAIEGKEARTEDDNKKLRAHYGSDVKLLGAVPLDTGVYTLCYSTDGSRVIAAGEDGKVRFISVSELKVTGEFTPVPLEPSKPIAKGDVQ